MNALETLSKKDAVARIEELLQKELSEESIAEIQQIKKVYDVLVFNERETQKQAHLSEGKHIDAFEVEKDPHDSKFKVVFNVFRDRKQTYLQQQKKEEDENYLTRKSILEKLQGLVSMETMNIGEAFKEFYALRDVWNETGNVNKALFKSLQYEYSRLRDQFYYNISIHKELRNYDFQKNLEDKQAIIEKMKHLLEVDSIKQVEHFIQEYQKEWDEIGPTYQESWEAIRDEYWKTTHLIYEKIKQHYHDIRERQKESASQKSQYIETIKQCVARLPQNHNAWKKATEQIQTLQKSWKSLAPLKKKKEETLWSAFNEQCNLFFEKKSAFYKQAKDTYNKHARQKKELVDKAIALQQSDTWKETTMAYQQLQAQWKKIGFAGPKEEHTLWKAFKEAGDMFFQRKKAFYDSLDDRREEGVAQKKEILEAMGKATSEEEIEKQIAAWYTIRFVSKKQSSKLNQAYRATLNRLFSSLNIDAPQADWIEFSAKIRAYKERSDSSTLLKDEKRFVQDRIRNLKAEVEQFENNLSFFGHSKGAQALKSEVETKINQSRIQLDLWERKLKWIHKK